MTSLFRLTISLSLPFCLSFYLTSLSLPGSSLPVERIKTLRERHGRRAFDLKQPSGRRGRLRRQRASVFWPRPPPVSRRSRAGDLNAWTARDVFTAQISAQREKNNQKTRSLKSTAVDSSSASLIQREISQSWLQCEPPPKWTWLNFIMRYFSFFFSGGVEGR